MTRRRPVLLAPILAVGFSAVALLAAGMPEVTMPAELQVPLLAKVLSFDRRLPARAGDELVIGVAYQPRFAEGAELAHELLEASRQPAGQQIEGIPCRWVALEVGDGSELPAALASQSVDVLYVTPLRALPLERITSAARSLGVVTVTGTSDYVAGGLAIGLVLRGDRARILVNLEAASSEGAELDSQLLKLATLVPDR
jgi:hypothetical protein